MVIREMNREECHRVLAGARLARLGCAHENQPYVVPVYLAYHQSSNGDQWLCRKPRFASLILTKA